jgi:hypothetical protein
MRKLIVLCFLIAVLVGLNVSAAGACPTSCPYGSICGNVDAYCFQECGCSSSGGCIYPYQTQCYNGCVSTLSSNCQSLCTECKVCCE